MITVIDKSNMDRFGSEMEQAHRLRHAVFVEEKGWEDLRKPDSLEVDQFDDSHAVHMICKQDDDVIGYQRLLPTTRPNLLSEIYPYLCEEEELPNSPTTWEWTRFAVKKSERKRGIILSPVGNALLSAIVEWGQRNKVDSVVIEMNPLWMLRLLQLHFRVQPIGYVHKISGEDTIAVTAGFNQKTLDRLREVRGDSQSVLEFEEQTTGAIFA